MLDRDDIHPLFADAPDSTEFRKLRKRIVRLTREALDTYGMVRPGDRWLVCLSGGKDSHTLLAALVELQWRGLLPVELLACNLDQGQPGFPATVLPEFLARVGVPHRIEYRDTYSVVTAKVPAAKTYCALCSRLRRGNLYRIAREEGCAAVVLGHHRDDIVDTFLLSLFHGGTLKAMPPKLLNDEGDLHVLRPLAHVAEADCARFARAMGLPDHPLRPLRQPGRAPACGDQAHGRRVGGQEPRAAADPVPGAFPGQAEPPARHRALRLQGALTGSALDLSGPRLLNRGAFMRV